MRVRCDLMTRRNETKSSAPPHRRVLVGGVGYRWMGDASFGLVVCDALAQLPLPAGMEVADLGYGAVYVAQDLLDAQPPFDRVILVAGVERGREPGRLYCQPWKRTPFEPDDIQARIREAGAGVIDLDHLLRIANYLEALPADVELIELEPVDTRCGDRLSARAELLMDEVLELVRRQARAGVEC